MPIADATAAAARTEPLLCPGCGAAVPLADGDTVPCPYCGATVELPESYRTLRDLHRIDASDRARVHAAWARLGAPPGRLFLWWVAAARGVMRAAASLSLLSFIAYMAVGSLVAGPMIARRAAQWRIDPVDVAGPFRFSLALSLAFELVLVAPLVVGSYRRKAAELRRRLGASLAATPPREPARPSTCRMCGAPLTVAADALGARCSYCGADNLVKLPPAWIAQRTAEEVSQHADATRLLDEQAEALRGARSSALLQVVGAVLLCALSTAFWSASLDGGQYTGTPWPAAVGASPRRLELWSGDRRGVERSIEAGAESSITVGASDRCHYLQESIPGRELSVALRAGETLQVGGALARLVVASSRDDRTWEPRLDGGIARFVAPWSGDFRVVVAPVAAPPTELRVAFSLLPAAGR